MNEGMTKSERPKREKQADVGLWHRGSFLGQEMRKYTGLAPVPSRYSAGPSEPVRLTVDQLRKGTKYNRIEQI